MDTQVCVAYHTLVFSTIDQTATT